MKVLVTGGAGFIGSHLVRSLSSTSEVVVLDSFTGEVSSVRTPAFLESEAVTVVRGDIRDSELLSRLFASGVSSVVHLAARTGVRESLTQTADYESVNVGGTRCLLEVMKGYPSVPLVFASSSSVYGVRRAGPFVESDPTDSPASPYAATKKAGELLCQAAHRDWGLNVTCLRFFTVYGPGQRPGMAIAKFVDQVLSGSPITVYGDGSSLRDYTWIGDAMAGIHASMDNPLGFRVYNIGAGATVTLGELVSIIAEAVGAEAKIQSLPEQEGDVPVTHASYAKAENELGWAPRVSLREGIRRYVDWRVRQNGRALTQQTRRANRSV